MTVKIIFLLSTVALLASSLPVNTNPELLSYSVSQNEHGYDFSYSTIDHQSREEHGVLVPRVGLLKDGEEGPQYDLEVHGSYSYVGDDFRVYTVNYVSGVNGYNAKVTISEDHEEEVPIINPNALKSLVG